MGRFKKGGVPDQISAARQLIQDWNIGKVKYFTLPPEDLNAASIHLDAKIVTEIAKEFDIENFEAMETETLAALKTSDLKDCTVQVNFYINESLTIQILDSFSRTFLYKCLTKNT